LTIGAVAVLASSALNHTATNWEDYVILRSLLLAVLITMGPVAQAADAPLSRGAYLTMTMGCGDCHTAGHFLGKPDLAHPLSGSDVGFQVPHLGYFWGPNLTPDAETGLGNWTTAQIVTALRTGVRPDGRILAPSMPWRNYTVLTDADAEAIASYLKSLPPTQRRVPGPLGADAKPAAPYLTVKMPE
jgi:mono/diheme cytochrome c family protein